MKALPGKNFWMATASSSLTIALFFCFPVVIAQMLPPMHNDNAEILGIIMLAAGIAGAISFQIVQHFLQISFLNMNRFISIACLFSTALFWIGLKSELACFFTVPLWGFTMVPILFVSYEFIVSLACQGTGLGEATPCGVINMLGNTLGALEIFALTPILAK